MAEPNSELPNDPHAADAGEISVHVVSPFVLLGVFVALLGLTYVTVAVTHFNLGDWNLVIAMAIATIKATLVALYFMHLRYDKSFYTIIFLAALLFLGLFISGALFDTLEYQPDTHPWSDAVSIAR